ncbi:MAG: hypothetical protein ACE5I8_04105 [Thermodesulfobacteriota bacterium]
MGIFSFTHMAVDYGVFPRRSNMAVHIAMGIGPYVTIEEAFHETISRGIRPYMIVPVVLSCVAY